MTIGKLRRTLYRSARILGDVDAATSPRKTRRRVKNRIVGRALGRAGVWRRLWR